MISSLEELFAKFIFDDDIKLEIINHYNRNSIYLDIISSLCEAAFVGHPDEKLINPISKIFALSFKNEKLKTTITITYEKVNDKFDRVININFSYNG